MLEVHFEEIVKDVRSGLIDSELMEKYGLSAKELRAVLLRLVDIEALAMGEVFSRTVVYDDTIDEEPKRVLPRHYLAFLLPIYEENNPAIRGWVTDITEKGVGVRGIEMPVGHKTTFIVAPKGLKDMGKIIFDAECRWLGKEEPDKAPRAGLAITNISAQDLRELRKFIRLITIGPSRLRDEPSER